MPEERAERYLATIPVEKQGVREGESAVYLRVHGEKKVSLRK
jgi:hypothetical protein